MKLKVDNDWENLTWFIGPVNVTNKLKEITIRWPNKTRTVHKVSWEENSVSVNDMGHEYSVQQDVARITINVYGLKMEVRLDKLLKCYVESYKVNK